MIDTKIIIARYKENVDWLQSVKIDKSNTRIYNKFYNTEEFTLPNVGREAHTYLDYILNNYDNLSTYTIFLQGDPFPHNQNIINDINRFLSLDSKPKYTFYPLAGRPRYEGLHGNVYIEHVNGLPMYYFLDLLFQNHNITNIVCNDGAQFIVHKNNILNRPIKFYEFLMKFVSYEQHPIEAYIFERLWPYIFDTSISLNHKYLNF